MWLSNNRNNTRNAERGAARSGEQAGFTLPELLVALAIFLSVMGGVGLLFVNGLRVMRQGFQNQEAFEQARSTLKIIEQDLSRAFTSRDYGDYYSFYGTPIGFSFVGVVAPETSGDQPNLARVTYVMWHPDTPDRADLLDPTDVDIVGSKRTYRLLRFVEPNVKTLDDYPVRWDDLPLTPLAQDSLGGGATLSTLIDLAVDRYVNGCATCPEPTGREIETVAAAARRELWIRLLSGGDDIVPSGWDPTLQSAQLIELDQNPSFVGVEFPEDYIVSENILYTYLDTDNLIDEDLTRNPFIHPLENLQPTGLDPTLGNFPAYFFLYSDVEVMGDQVRSVSVRYWNDIRNFEIPNNGIDDDRDGQIDEEFAGNPGMTQPVGSPLTPRLPQEVSTFFTLFFESPYPGAPDFRRRFDQRIDIPAGYRRLRGL